MLEENIKKNARVKIFPVAKESGRVSELEKSKQGSGTIQKFVSETEIEILLEEDASFEKKVCYAVYILSYEKVYLIYTYYRASFYEDGKTVVSFDIVSPMERVQRRMHQRVSCHSRILFGKVPAGNIPEHGVPDREQMELPAQEYEESMVDISGGGIRFTSKREMNCDDVLYVTFELELDNKRTAISVLGQIVYAEKLRNEQNYYDIRMKYVGISEAEREQIIHFVFYLERNE